jgi:predicted enzyme related to lactoylglutathione lyase
MKRSFGFGLVLAASLACAPVAQAQTSKAPAAKPVKPDPATLNLSFVKFNVSDQPAMQAFYMKAFGMTLQKRIDNPQLTEIILTDPKGLDLALVHYKDGRKIAIGSAEGPIGFYLNDVDTAYNRAMAAGATSKSRPRAGGGLRVAIVADPEGHEIELLHLD